jgi:hypothetical protein
MQPASRRIERALWAVAAACAASAVGIHLWNRLGGRASLPDGIAAWVAACGPVAQPPAAGPVPLPTCRGTPDGVDPWLVPGAHGPGLDALAGLSPRTERLRWTWEDVNTVPVLRWDGDTRVVRPGARGRTLAVSAEIDSARAAAMERAFGYATDAAVIRYRQDAELAAKRASLDRTLTAHGVLRRRTADGDVLAPDHEWMIQASLDDVRPLAQAILREARRRGARGEREEFGAFASFVQCLKYGECPDPGDAKHRFGLSMPLWALATGIGDCDTRAVLLAALARSVGLPRVHLVRDADHAHMLAAAELPVLKGDRFVRDPASGRQLVLVETTDHWPVGRVASRTPEGDRLQTLFLAEGRPGVSGGAALTPPRSPRPTAMPEQPTGRERRTSARSTPPR